MKKKLQIRDISQLTGLDRETLRFYEQKGLLPKPTRTDSGYRQFDSEVVIRLKFIKLAQEVGFSLKEILELLNIGQTKTLSKMDLKNIAKEKISDIDERIKSLKSMRKALNDLSQRASKITSKSNCPILSQFKTLDV